MSELGEHLKSINCSVTAIESQLRIECEPAKLGGDTSATV